VEPSTSRQPVSVGLRWRPRRQLGKREQICRRIVRSDVQPPEEPSRRGAVDSRCTGHARTIRDISGSHQWFCFQACQTICTEVRQPSHSGQQDTIDTTRHTCIALLYLSSLLIGTEGRLDTKQFTVAAKVRVVIVDRTDQRVTHGDPIGGRFKISCPMLEALIFKNQDVTGV
jgi:hypothetical protein